MIDLEKLRLRNLATVTELISRAERAIQDLPALRIAQARLREGLPIADEVMEKILDVISEGM